MPSLSKTSLLTLSLALLFGACSKPSDGKSDLSQPSAGGGSAAGNAAGSATAGDASGGGIDGTVGGAGGVAISPTFGGGGSSSYSTAGVAGIAGAASGCAPVTNQVTAVPPILMFQIDITGSMELSTPTTNGQSKWEASKKALTNALRRLPSDWMVGVTFFNKSGTCYGADQQTTVPVAPLNSAQLNTIATAIDAQRPGGNTPTFCAWQTAATDVLGYRPPEGSVYAQSQRYVVLMTDGVPTVNRDCCSLGASPGGTAITQDEYNHTITTMRGAFEKSTLRTFVIGVPGSEDRQGAEYDPRCMLSQMAEAGGTATPSGCTSEPGIGSCTLSAADAYCHIDLTTTLDFSTALEEVIVTRIGHSVTSCNYPVPASKDDDFVDAKRTTILYRATEGESAKKLVAASSSACTDGDYYFSFDARGYLTNINLCPKRCEEVQANRAAELSVQFACLTIG